MGDVLTPSPYAFDSPEAKAEREAELRGAGLAATNLLPGMLAQVLPWRTDAEGNTHAQLPLTGAATAAYGGAGTLIPMGINYGLGKVGINTRLGALPGAQSAMETYEDTSRAARNLVPHMQATSPEEQVIEDMAFSGGGMALPGSGLIGGLPKVARIVAHTIVPTATTTMAAPIIGAAATGGLEAYQQKKQDDLYREMGFDPAVHNRPGMPAVDLSQPDTSSTVAHPETGAPATVPFTTSSTQTTTALPSLIAKAEAAPTTPSSLGPPPQLDANGKIIVPGYGTEGNTGVSLAEVGAAAITALGLGHGLLKYGGKLFEMPLRTMTGTADQLDTAANAAAHNANLDALDAGRSMGGMDTAKQAAATRGEAPLPGKAGSIGTNLSQKYFDKTRQVDALNQATAPSKTASEQLSADIGTTLGGSGLHNRIDEQAGTGINLATGHNIPKLKAALQDADRLTPEQQKVLDDGLHAGNELDNRIKRRRDLTTSTYTPTEVETRYNYHDVQTRELQSAHDKMMNDPATANVAKQLYASQMSNIGEGYAMGRITLSRAQEILRDRPRQIPTLDLEGRSISTLKEPDMSKPGFQTPNGRAIDAIVQHYGDLYQDYNKNILLDKIIKQGEAYQLANPDKARFFNKTTSGSTEGRAISVWRDGVEHTYQIDHSGLYHAMKGNPGKLSTFMNSADWLRRSMQSGTTGVAASIVGRRPYALINLNRNIAQIPTYKTYGKPFGPISRLAHKAGIEYRGPDPVAIAGSYHQGISGAINVTAKNIADMLRNRNPLSMALRGKKGDAWVDALAQRLQARYDRTNVPGGLAERRGQGLGGAGSGGTADQPIYNLNVKSEQAYNPLTNAAPGLFHPDGMHIPFTKVPIPGTKGVLQQYINLRTLFRDIHQEINDGANSYHYKEMRQAGDSPEVAHFEARRVLGDPSMTGSSPAVQGAGKLIGYFNPSLQDAVRMSRNLRDNPISFILGMSHTLTMMAATELFTAMLGGSKHMNMLGQLMSSHERASNMTFFHDPTNEHNYTQISLPQFWRQLYPYYQEMAGYASGAWQARPGEAIFNRVIHSLADMLSQPLSTGTRNAMIQGGSDFWDVAQAPQIVRDAANVVGYDIKPPLGTAASNYAEGKPLTEGIFSPLGKPTNIPNQEAVSSVISNDDNKWMRTLFGNINGVAGKAIYDAFANSIDRFNVNHSFADMWDGLVGDAGQSLRDNAPFGNMIWGNNIKQTTHNPLGDNVELALTKGKDFSSATRDAQMPGLTREGGVPIMQSGAEKLNPDPTIRRMAFTVNDTMADLNSTLVPQLRDLQKQYRAITEDTLMPPQDKRTLENQMAGKINDKYGDIDHELMILNANLSQMAGGKHVDVRNFHMDRGMDQFHD